MKKRLLFVTQYLKTGGVEKSLLTVLSSIDYEKYDIDLLLFDHSGVLFNEIPQEVNVLPPLFEEFSTPMGQAFSKLLKSGKIRLLAGKAMAGTLSKLSKGIGTGSRWRVYRYTLNKLTHHYDVAISYLDFFCNYYVIEKVSADKKILYNHMDYSYSQKTGWPSPTLDRKSFAQSDYIVTVAESSKASLISFFPELSNRITIIHNSVLPSAVRSRAKATPEQTRFREDKGFKIVTVSRLAEEKGIIQALEACKKLVDNGLAVKWYIVGAGSLHNELTKKINTLGMKEHFILLGEQSNPYPYIGQCDVYVQPSKTEAHCVAVEEAIALYKPIVVTNIPSFQSQIKHGETGIVVESTSDGLVEGIEQLYSSKVLREGLCQTLKRLPERHKKELSKLYQLIEN